MHRFVVHPGTSKEVNYSMHEENARDAIRRLRDEFGAGVKFRLLAGNFHVNNPLRNLAEQNTPGIARRCVELIAV
jgi:hypothetical protein